MLVSRANAALTREIRGHSFLLSHFQDPFVGAVGNHFSLERDREKANKNGWRKTFGAREKTEWICQSSPWQIEGWPVLCLNRKEEFFGKSEKGPSLILRSKRNLISVLLSPRSLLPGLEWKKRNILRCTMASFVSHFDHHKKGVWDCMGKGEKDSPLFQVGFLSSEFNSSSLVHG